MFLARHLVALAAVALLACGEREEPEESGSLHVTVTSQRMLAPSVAALTIQVRGTSPHTVGVTRTREWVSGPLSLSFDSLPTGSYVATGTATADGKIFRARSELVVTLGTETTLIMTLQQETPPGSISQSAPAILSVLVVPPGVPGGAYRLSVNATDADPDDVLSYQWFETVVGTFTGTTDRADAQWTPPAGAGPWELEIWVTDTTGIVSWLQFQIPAPPIRSPPPTGAAGRLRSELR